MRDCIKIRVIYSLELPWKIFMDCRFFQLNINPKRKINITRRKRLNVEMRLIYPKRGYNTFPVIVPPVTHKSLILNNAIRPIWVKAEKALSIADEILIFGYSCPSMDFESSNLIERAIKANRNYQYITILDPDPTVLIRYQKLLEPNCLRYYPYASNFLKIVGGENQ